MSVLHKVLTAEQRRRISPEESVPAAGTAELDTLLAKADASKSTSASRDVQKRELDHDFDVFASLRNKMRAALRSRYSVTVV